MGEFVSFTLFVKRILPIYISGKISCGNDGAGIKLRHLCRIPGDNFRLARRSWASAPALKKKTASWKSHESAVKATHLALLWWVGDSVAQQVFELGGQFEIAETHKSPMTPKGFLIFALFFCLSYRKSIWMATRFFRDVCLYMSSWPWKASRMSKSEPTREWVVSRFFSQHALNIAALEILKSFNGIRTSTNHGGILHSHAMRNYCRIWNWMAVGCKRLVSGQRHLHLLGGFKYFLFSPLLGEDEPNLTSIFFKGVETTNQIYSYLRFTVVGEGTNFWFCWFFVLQVAAGTTSEGPSFA